MASTYQYDNAPMLTLISYNMKASLINKVTEKLILSSLKMSIPSKTLGPNMIIGRKKTYKILPIPFLTKSKKNKTSMMRKIIPTRPLFKYSRNSINNIILSCLTNLMAMSSTWHWKTHNNRKTEFIKIIFTSVCFHQCTASGTNFNNHDIVKIQNNTKYSINQLENSSRIWSIRGYGKNPNYEKL